MSTTARGTPPGANRGTEPRGNLLRYLPSDCAAYRVYIDVAAVVSTLQLGDVLTSERMPGPWKPVFSVFESAHLRLGREIQEIAVCAQEVSADEDARSKIYVAIGGQLGGRDALHTYRTVVQELTHATETAVLEKESAGVPYLVSSFTPTRKWIAMPGQDVLVFYTDSVDRVAELAEPRDADGARWRLGGSVIASFEGSSGGDDDTMAANTWGATVSVERPDASDATLLLDGEGSLPTAALDPALLASIPAKLGGAFARSPFLPLADPVKAMSLRVRGHALHVRLDVPVAKLIEAGAVAARDHHAVRELWRNLQQAVRSTRR